MSAEETEVKVIPIGEMYEEYFLDYASYVILERAVPTINDGLKPVQRRILYSLREKDDGRYHKVANIIGHTMQYHPHGDAAIGDAMVKLGQKDLMIDTQGNWGDARTGDSAAAPRYIEARLTKFALEVAFNNQTTQWQLSYDGRNNEPVNLPMKFPLLLAQGTEGIAVGLSTKIMPHNFKELIKASIRILEDKSIKIYPDFQTGGFIDVTEYNRGKRGGKVKVRSRIEVVNKNTLSIKELPYGVTTTALIDSVIKANEKGQIKIKKIIDNTAKDVDIQVDLISGVSPEVTMDALYAFTQCEVSISPNACVIIDNKPHFLTVEDILRTSTIQTKDLLRQELEIRRKELEEKWHLASLEKIFIENRIYRDIEEAESFEAAIKIIDKGLRKYVSTPKDNSKKGDDRLMLMREISDEDIIHLTEIRIKRISKYNKFRHEENMVKLVAELEQVIYDLEHLTDYAIAYFNKLLEKYGKGKERKTEITNLETIKAVAVAANNTKLYVDLKEGFIGNGSAMKKEEFVVECSDIDDIIAFRKDGKFQVSRIGDKVFMGKNILHVGVWKKGDDRTTYNMIYVDAKSGRTMAKRFNVTAITRDKEYDLTKGEKGSKCLYFTANLNGESEIVQITLSPGCSAKKKIFELDFEELSIKGRGSGGNIVTKYPVKKLIQLSVGKSSLGAIKAWMDQSSGRLNKEERGLFLGEFDTGDQIVAIYKNGSYEMRDLVIDSKIDVDGLLYVAKYKKGDVISAMYHEGEKGWTMVKRFEVETTKNDQRFSFVTESRSSKLYYATTEQVPIVIYSYKEGGSKTEREINLAEFIDVKGWKALGNKLGEHKVLSAKGVKIKAPKSIAKTKSDTSNRNNDKLLPGTTIEMDF
ncbi:MAG: DNA gyrase/topoisomerase IV subunit A [Saprospiraceae bacterium]